MLNIKRLLITFMILCSANIAFADSCIMISDAEITDIKCPENCIVSVRALTTLANEKKSVIVTSLKDGESEFSVKIKSRYYCYKVKVCKGKLEICGSNKLKILSVDLPPEALPEKECDK